MCTLDSSSVRLSHSTLTCCACPYRACTGPCHGPSGSVHALFGEVQHLRVLRNGCTDEPSRARSSRRALLEDPNLLIAQALAAHACAASTYALRAAGCCSVLQGCAALLAQAPCPACAGRQQVRAPAPASLTPPHRCAVPQGAVAALRGLPGAHPGLRAGRRVPAAVLVHPQVGPSVPWRPCTAGQQITIAAKSSYPQTAARPRRQPSHPACGVGRVCACTHGALSCRGARAG